MDIEEPRIFEITVGGASGIVWSDWLDDVEVVRRLVAPPITVLRGPMDQATLRGVLNRLWDLNLTLVSVVSVSIAGAIGPASMPAEREISGRRKQ